MGSRKGAFCFTWSHHAKAIQRNVSVRVHHERDNGCRIGCALHADSGADQALHERIDARDDQDCEQYAACSD